MTRSSCRRSSCPRYQLGQAIRLTFEAVGIVLAVTPPHAELSWTLLGVDDLESGQDAADTDHGLAAFVCARNGEVEIVDRQELWRDILQLDDVEEFELLLKPLEDLTSQLNEDPT
jgi:hypothetical protein